MPTPPTESNVPAIRDSPAAGDVFISHHSSQYETAKAVKAALAEVGVRGWLAPDDVDPGSAFDTQILDQLKRSGAIVLLLSAEADRSRHVKRELMLADDEGVAVFPVRIEAIRAEGLAYFLKDKQWIDWLGGKGEGLNRLVQAVDGHFHGRAPDRPATIGQIPGRRNPRRWPWVAGAAAVLAAAVAAWFLVPRGPEPIVKPGLYLNKRELVEILYPEKIAEVETRQLKTMIETDPNPEECVTEEVARNPDVKMFDPGNKGGCALNGFQVGNGRMSGYLICPVQGAKDASMSVVFQATYTKDSITMDSTVTIARPSGTLRFKARDTSHWLADKCPNER